MRQQFYAKSFAICRISRDGVPQPTNLISSPELDIIASVGRIAARTLGGFSGTYRIQQLGAFPTAPNFLVQTLPLS